MANVKLVLRKETKKDGTSPLAIRITKDRKSSYIYLEYSIKEDDWDVKNQRVKKSHPNSTRLNNFLATKVAEALNRSLEIETERKDVSSKTVRQKIKPNGGATFFAQADLYIQNLEKDGKYNRYTADKPRVKHFKEFLKGQNIAFTDITIPLLERFKGYIKTELKLSERSAINHLVVIRSVFSQAVKSEIVDRKYYPFGAGKISIKFPDSLKIGLTPEEVYSIETIELAPGSFENHCRNLWLFSFYFAGMRISDVFRIKWSDIQNGRLFYSMGKNDKGGSLKIPEKALSIIAQYKDDMQSVEDYIFPELKTLIDKQDKFIEQRRIMNMTSRVDKTLQNVVAKRAGISKRLTMHIARHTFGNISGDRIPIQMLQKLYRHSSVTTTIGYQANFVNKDADDALDMVINN
ncbi:MAG TPA: site-specific integrase [Chitinophagales bacterium]|nr:site-specific integrase [Chitinophagales bacterium]